MRIAVSGTHCSGKSTLVEDFLAVHRDYVHEPEPYEWLEDGDFDRQLDLSVERLSQYAPGMNVIAERSPLDFIAYMLALADLRRTVLDPAQIASATERAAIGMAHLDLLVVLPADGIVAPDDEDLELREAMNERLLDLVVGDMRPVVIEIHGTPAQRLRRLEEQLTIVIRP